MMGFQKLHTAMNYLELQRILDALAGERIPAYARESGEGQYFQIRSGVAFVEKNIYVEEKDAERAGLLIRYLTEIGSELATKKGDGFPWRKRRRMMVKCGSLFGGLLRRKS